MLAPWVQQAHVWLLERTLGKTLQLILLNSSSFEYTSTMITSGKASSEAEPQMKGGLLLDIVISERAAILELLTCENQPTLVTRDALKAAKATIRKDAPTTEHAKHLPSWSRRCFTPRSAQSIDRYGDANVCRDTASNSAQTGERETTPKQVAVPMDQCTSPS